MMRTEQTQKMKNEPDLSKPWPFRWVNGVDTLKCNVKYTKEPKCKLYATFDDLGEPLF
jgi:hypothetical protein